MQETSRWFDRSIRNVRHSVRVSGCQTVAFLFGTHLAETALATGYMRPQRQVGHMVASDLVKISARTSRKREPPTYDSTGSVRRLGVVQSFNLNISDAVIDSSIRRIFRGECCRVLRLVITDDYRSIAVTACRNSPPASRGKPDAKWSISARTAGGRPRRVVKSRCTIPCSPRQAGSTRTNLPDCNASRQT